MDDLHEFIERTKKAADLGNLPWWTPTQKTPAIVGRVIEYHQINTEYGMMPGAAVELLEPAVVQDSAKDRPRLAEPGENVMIWQKNTVLRNMWTAPASGGGPPAVGEIVGVKLTGERHGGRGTYPTFWVSVAGRDAAKLAATNGARAPEVPEDDPTFGNPAWPTGEEDWPPRTPPTEADDLPF